MQFAHAGFGVFHAYVVNVRKSVNIMSQIYQKTFESQEDNLRQGYRRVLPGAHRSLCSSLFHICLKCYKKSLFMTTSTRIKVH